MAMPMRHLACLMIGLWMTVITAEAQAAGFGVFTHGAYALGQSNAVTAHNYLPSAVFFNPALINALPGTQVEIGTTVIAPRQKFTSAATGTGTDGVDSEYFPSTFFMTQHLSDEFSVGLGLFNPFGLGTEWPQDWEGRYQTTQSELSTIDFNPVLSWQVSPDVSVAAGAAFMWLDATLQNKLNMALVGLPGLPDGNQKFEGNGQGVGYNMGLSAKLSERTSLGISYRSAIDVRSDGKVSTQLPAGSGAVAGLFPTTDARAKIHLPRQISAGIAYQISSKAIIETGFRWEEWSAFDELRITFDQPVAGQTEKVTPREWNNSFAVNIGGQYKFTDTYSLLLGFLYENSPVPDDTFEPVIPDSESCLYSIGMAADHKNFKYSISYGLQMKSDRDKHNTISAPDGSTANGTYEAYIHLLGVSFSYRF